MRPSDWRRNIRFFLITTFFQWFYVPIGVWVLIWGHYFSWQEISSATALGMFVSLLLELPSGALADVVGRKKTILFGRILGVAGFAILSIAVTMPLLVLGLILYQANWAFESGALSALLYDSLKENGVEKEFYQKTEADGFFFATMGMAVASLLGGYLYTIGPHVPYMATTVVAVAAFMTALGLEEPKLDTIKVSFRSYLQQNWDGFTHIFRNPLIRAVSLFSILIDFVAYVGLWYLFEPRLAEGGFPATWMGMLVAGSYVMRAFGTKLIPLVMRLGDRTIPLFLTLFQMIGSALSFIDSKGGAIASVYSRKMSDGFRKPILSRLQNEEIASRYRATSLSAISLLSSGTIAAAGPITGYFMDTFSVRVTLGAFFFVGLVLVLPSAYWLTRQIKK